MSDSKITINGRELTDDQIMTVKVALSSFSVDLHDGSFGDHEMGKSISNGYQANILDIDNLFRMPEAVKVL